MSDTENRIPGLFENINDPFPAPDGFEEQSQKEIKVEEAVQETVKDTEEVKEELASPTVDENENNSTLSIREMKDTINILDEIDSRMEQEEKQEPAPVVETKVSEVTEVGNALKDALMQSVPAPQEEVKTTDSVEETAVNNLVNITKEAVEQFNAMEEKPVFELPPMDNRYHLTKEVDTTNAIPADGRKIDAPIVRVTEGDGPNELLYAPGMETEEKDSDNLTVEDMVDMIPTPTQRPEPPRETIEENKALLKGLEEAAKSDEKKPEEVLFPESSDKLNLRRRLNTNTVPSSMKVKGIFSRSLSFFLGNFRKTHRVEEEMPVMGHLITRTNSTGLWEEGGATPTEGSVMIATDPKGNKLPPVVVSHRKDIVNGSHALVPCWAGCYILMGGHRKGELILVIYHVDSIKFISDSGATYPRFVCSAVAYVAGAEWKVQNPNLLAFWNIKHPAVTAALNRITEQYATSPCYVQEYREHFFDNHLKQDFVNCLKDQEYYSRVRDYETLSDAYVAANVWLGSKVASAAKDEHVLLLTWVNDRPQDNTVAVFLYGIVYNVNTHTSEGKREWYGRVILHPGDKFYYADQSESDAIDYEEMRKDLVKPPYNGKSLITLRRMLEKIEY